MGENYMNSGIMGSTVIAGGANAGQAMAVGNPQYNYNGGPYYTENVVTVSAGANPIMGSSNFNITSIGQTIKTSLEVFEELVGLIKLIELKLNLDPKDDSKHKWLEMIMGRIQEETINNTIQRLKALKL